MFTEKFEKNASNLVRGLEHAGLGILAAPSIATLADKNADKKDKIKAGAETAGLGALSLGVEAAHPGSAVNRVAKKYLPKLMKG